MLTRSNTSIATITADTKFLAVGSDAAATAASAGGLDAVALGARANASAANSVAIGAGSVADRNLAGLGLPATVVGTVSFGAKDAERQLVNVAAGTQATDAVNKGQMDTEIADVRSDIATDITEIQNTINDTTNTTINEKTKYLAVNSTGTAAAATGVDSIAVGGGSSVAAGVTGGVALGNNAKVNAGALNSVAIGAGSVADRCAFWAGTAGTVSFGTRRCGSVSWSMLPPGRKQPMR